MLSAGLDGEAAAEELALADRHVASCPACARFATRAGALHRRARLQPAAPVPDLTAAVMADAPDPAGVPTVERDAARWGLVAIAAVQLALALPAFVTGAGQDAPVHATRELGGWSAALAVGLLVAAWQPARARGLLPLGLAVVGVLAVGALVDVLGGRAGSAAEAVHLLEAAGVGVLWLLARRQDDLGRGPAPA